MKNVGIIISNITNSAGTERAVTNLANMLVKDSKYGVFIFSLYSNSNEVGYYYLNDKVKVIHLGFPFEHGVKRIGIYRKLINVLNQKVCEYHINFILGTTHGYNSLLPYIKNCKKVACEHMNYESCTKIGKIIRKINYPKLDAVVLLTQADSRHYDFISNNKKYVIPNSLSFTCEKPAELQKKRMISVGRLAEQKGYDILIHMAIHLKKELPDWHIDIFGDGEERENLQELIIQNNLSDFVKINRPVRNIQNEMLNASLYLFSSRHEGFGLVLIEAQACGLPIVGFDCPEGPADIIKDDRNGFLIPLGNENEFVNAVVELVKNNGKRIEFGRNAFTDSEKYNESNIFYRWNELFTNI